MINALMTDRRSLMQHAMLLMGATALSGCDLLPGSSAPAELGADQQRLLQSFADTLIPQTDSPGAVAAGVPATFAAMYRDWASDATRTDLSGALDRIDAAARKAKGKGFAELSASDRQAFLANHDKAALVAVPPPADAPKGNPFVPIISVVDNGYAKLKDLVATLHYASEAALTSDLAYDHVPGGWTASVPVTPETRPAITFGAF